MRHTRLGFGVILTACFTSSTLGQTAHTEFETARWPSPWVATNAANDARALAAGAGGTVGPVCAAAAADGNCQAADGSVMWSIDPVNGGAVVADDFIAESTQITEFCFSPCFAGVGNVADCADPNGATPPPPARVFVQFLEDGANDSDPETLPGFPGAPLPGSPGFSDPIAASAAEWQGPGSSCWDYSVEFDPPISGMTVGQRYWVELFSPGSRDSEGNGCEVFINGSLSGNGWAMRRDDTFGFTYVYGNNSVHAWKERSEGADLPQDWPFCIDGGLTVPPPMTGACCSCDGTCDDGVAWDACLASSAIDAEGNTFTLTEAVGSYFPTKSCAEIFCDNADTGAPGQDCTDPIIIDHSPFEIGTVDYSNVCAIPDAPVSFSECDGEDLLAGNDIWFQATTDTNWIEIDVCSSQVDIVTSIYTNGTSTCPNELGQCPPDDAERVFCSDQECSSGGFGSPTTGCWARATCLDGPDVGQWCFADEDCTDGTCEPQCFLIRVSGLEGDVGTGQVSVSSFWQDCPISSPVVQETMFVESSGTHEVNKKERFLSFSAGDPGIRQAIWVTVTAVTELHHEYLLGSQWWVQPSRAVSELGTSAEPLSGSRNFSASPLGCAPYYTDWNGVCRDGQCDGGLRGASCVAGAGGGVCVGGPSDGDACTVGGDCPGESCSVTTDCGGGIVNVYGEAIVPGASYGVVVIADGCSPLMNKDDWFMFLPTIVTTAEFGDIVSSCTDVLCFPAGDGPNVGDILAAIAGFASSPAAPSKTRTEVEPSRLDFLLNISDVLLRIRAFQGLSYPALRCDVGGTDRCVGGPHAGQPCASNVDCELELCQGFARNICSGSGGL